MSRAVSNASPLIYLAKIGRLDLLRDMFDEVLIPEEVRKEVVDEGRKLGRRDVFQVERALREGWLRTCPLKANVRSLGLHPGEEAVIFLGKQEGNCLILVDESAARTAARMLGLTPRGTIFILLKAVENGKLDMDGFLAELQSLVKAGFRLGEDVYLESVRKARELVQD
jgi:predicted nucleic acid-binding protein